MADVFPAEAGRQPRPPAPEIRRRRWTSRRTASSSVSTRYRKAIDCLKPGDVAILATPPAFRWVQFSYAIDKGLNVFMEKPRHGGRSHHAPHAEARRGVGAEEPEGRGRADDPALPRAAGAARAASATGRSATSSRCAPTAWASGGGTVAGPKPRRNHRADAPDPLLPRVPVGQRRRVQRLLHPPDRRVLAG